MILPSKHLSYDRALLTIGARVLSFLKYPRTCSALWEEVNNESNDYAVNLHNKITYDWFILALDILYAFEAIEYKDGQVMRRSA